MVKKENTWLFKYREAIRSGEIIAGQELIMQLDRLIADMDNPRYVYDTREANRRMDFIENCIKLTKSPFYGKPMKLMLFQKAFIETIYSFKMASTGFDRFKKVILLIGRKNGKALALNTPIPTPDGVKTMGEIKVGDYVFSELGKPVKVIAESEIFKNRVCYKITFEDGEEIIADENHKWAVQTKHTRRLKKYGYKVLTTKDMINDFVKVRRDGKGKKYKYRVPTNKTLGPEVSFKSIVNIERVENQDTKCITVDNPRSLFLCGNKNTCTHNSELCSSLMLTEMILGNPGSDIVASSNDETQANILYDAVDVMRKMIDPDQRDTWRNQQHIRNKATNSKIFKLSDKTRNKEGRNIDFSVIDECHEQKESVILKSIEQSQSLKDNPKLIIISTEGFVNDGTLDQLLIECRRIISGEEDGIAAERTLPWLYTQDSPQEIWQDERSWQKSNPTVGTIKKWDYLREQIDLASRSKADRTFVLSKDYNIKQSNSQAWLLPEDYEYEAKFDIEEFRNSIALGAVDLAETTDLTCAKILLMKPNDNTKYVYTQYFIPESKLETSPDFSSGAKYFEWAKQGHIKICEGNENDLSVVADWFYELYKKYGIKILKCGYDQRFAKDFLNRMDYYGFECEMVYQNKQTLSNPMKLLEADLKSQRINYNENPVDQWCFGNASVEVDNFGQCMAVKINNQAVKRIDGAVTTIILYEMYRRYRSEFNQYVNR